MALKIDLQAQSTENLDAHDAADTSRLVTLIADVQKLRGRADELSAEAQIIITRNKVVRAFCGRRR